MRYYWYSSIYGTFVAMLKHPFRTHNCYLCMLCLMLVESRLKRSNMQYCTKVLSTLDVRIRIPYEISSGSHLTGPKCILQHDNKLKHRVLQMIWPSQSPDLNIMQSGITWRDRSWEMPKSCQPWKKLCRCTEESWCCLKGKSWSHQILI